MIDLIEFDSTLASLQDDPPDDLAAYHNPDARYDDEIFTDVPLEIALRYWDIDELRAAEKRSDYGPWVVSHGSYITIGGGD